MISLLLPYLSYERFMSRKQEEPMACDRNCPKCTCAPQPEPPCGFLSYDNDFPFEADSCGLAILQDKWLNSPSTALDRHCALQPWAVECKLYED